MTNSSTPHAKAASSRHAATRGEEPTFNRFAQAIAAATPPTGILDAASQGVWRVAEQAGLLAGVWRRHRNLMQDLDTDAVTTILGELLVAVAQTTQALGVPLDVVAQQQVERLRTQATVSPRSRSARNARASARRPSALPVAATSTAPEVQGGQRVQTPTRRRSAGALAPSAASRKRREKQTVVGQTATPAVSASPESAPGGSTGRPGRQESRVRQRVASAASHRATVAQVQQGKQVEQVEQVEQANGDKRTRRQTANPPRPPDPAPHVSQQPPGKPRQPQAPQAPTADGERTRHSIPVGATGRREGKALGPGRAAHDSAQKTRSPRPKGSGG